MKSPAFDFGIGSVVVAIIWLAFYVIVAVDVSKVRQNVMSMDVSQNHQIVKNIAAQKLQD